MNDEHFRQVQAIVEESNRMAKDLAEKLGSANALDQVFHESNKLWLAQFPQSKGWGKRLHLDLSGADFSGALFACGVGTIEGANFKDAKLDRTRWFHIMLDKADFMHASLRNSIFTLCWASATTFSGADLRDAHINISSSGNVTDFTGADLRNAELTLGMISPALPSHFFDSDLLMTGANMEGCRVSVYDKLPSYLESKRGEQLYTFLQSLSEEQQRQVTFTEPTLQPLQPSKSMCFIATAVYGSALTPQVQLLQQFRQEYLQPHWLGRLLVRTYYQVSPLLADWIRERPKVRRVVRRILDFVLVVLARKP